MRAVLVSGCAEVRRCAVQLGALARGVEAGCLPWEALILRIGAAETTMRLLSCRGGFAHSNGLLWTTRAMLEDGAGSAIEGSAARDGDGAKPDAQVPRSPLEGHALLRAQCEFYLGLQMWGLEGVHREEAARLLGATGRAVREALSPSHPCMSLWQLGLCELLGSPPSASPGQGNGTEHGSLTEDRAARAALSRLQDADARFPALSPVIFLSLIQLPRALMEDGGGKKELLVLRTEAERLSAGWLKLEDDEKQRAKSTRRKRNGVDAMSPAAPSTEITSTAVGSGKQPEALSSGEPRGPFLVAVCRLEALSLLRLAVSATSAALSYGAKQALLGEALDAVEQGIRAARKPLLGGMQAVQHCPASQMLLLSATELQVTLR